MTAKEIRNVLESLYSGATDSEFNQRGYSTNVNDDDNFMTTIENRLTRIEAEVSFRHWVRIQRSMEAMSVDELELLAATGQRPDRPEPALGTSRFDSMDRASLIKLWKEDLESFAGRSSDELGFYAVHGHWPE